MATYAIKGEDKILVTEQNRNSLEWYKFIQAELSEKDLVEQEFQNSIKQLTEWFSQAEIDSFDKKVSEAQKVLNGETSVFLNTLCVEWEKVEDLANLILARNDAFELAYAQAEQIKRTKLKELS